MTITAPTKDGVRELGRELGIDMSDEDVGFFHEMLGGGLATAYGPLDAEADYLPQVKYPRAPGYRPTADEDPLGAWYYNIDIQGAPRGKLKGKRVALKARWAQTRHADGALRPFDLWRALLCQSTKPRPQAPRRLRHDP